MKKRTVTAMFFSLMLLSVLIIALLVRAEKKRNIQQAEYVMLSEISKIQYAIDSRLLSAEIFEMIIVNNQGTIKEYENTE